MINNQQRRHSQQMMNSKKPIKPIEITLTKKNYAQRENNMRGSSQHGIEINTKITVHNTKSKDLNGLSINTQRTPHQSLRQSSAHHLLGAKIRKPLIQSSTVNISNQDQLIIRCSSTNKDKQWKGDCLDRIGEGCSQQQYVSHIGWGDGRENQQGYLRGQERGMRTVRPKLIESVSYRQVSQSISYGSVENRNGNGNCSNQTHCPNYQSSSTVNDYTQPQTSRHQQQPANNICNSNDSLNTAKSATISIQQYRQLQQGLQRCLQQMGQLEMNNALEQQRVVQLQKQMLEMGVSHDKEKQQLMGRIEEQQTKQQQLIKRISFLEMQLYSNKQQSQSNSNPTYLQQLNFLKQQLSLFSISHNYTPSSPSALNSSFHSIKQSVSLQNIVREIEILKRKMVTLQQMLSAKKAQIRNKDHMIKLLIKQQTLMKKHLTQPLNQNQERKQQESRQKTINDQQQIHFVDEKELEVIIEEVYRSIEIKLKLL